MSTRHITIALLLIVPTLVAGCGKAAPTATFAPADTEAARPTSTLPALQNLTGSGGGVIAFSSTRDGNEEIYVMNADGSDQRRLTNNPAYDHIPAWSPDGTRLAFFSDRYGDREIYVMKADGTDVQQLTDNDADDLSPAWRP